MADIKPQLEMLLECYNIMQRRYNAPNTAMSALVQWIAYQLSIPSSCGYATPTVTTDMYHDLYAVLDLDLLREDPWDWLGELAVTLNLGNWVPYTTTRDETLEFASTALSGFAGSLGPESVIFDPLAGTGRLFFALLELGAQCIMAGAEPLRKPYRILIVNKYIYDMPIYVVNAQHSTPFNSKSWRKANHYLPVRSFPRCAS